MLKKKKTLSDTNYEGKEMYRNRKQHDICGKLQDKDGYKFAPYSDGEQEVFDTHDCQTGRTQSANSQLNFTSLILYKLKNNCSHEISHLALALR